MNKNLTKDQAIIYTEKCKTISTHKTPHLKLAQVKGKLKIPPNVYREILNSSKY